MRTVFRCATALLLGGVVACQGGVQSGVRPPVVTPPAPTPPRAAPIAWRARYDATPTSYRVRVETRLARDSAGQREEAPVTTTARVTLSWPAAGGGAARRVMGRITEFVVTGSDRIADPTKRVDPLVTAFEGSLDSAAVRLSVTPSLANECDAPQTAALALARDLVVRWPMELVVGASWRDSSVTFSCRAGLPITTRVRARYEVRPGAEANTLEVVRTSELELAGELRQAFRAVRLRGRGTGEHRFLLSLGTGAIARVEGTTTTELTVSDAARGGEQRVRQTAVLRAEREP